MTGESRPSADDADAIGEGINATLQLLLAEKRTAMALLRTGIAVMVLPMSVISFLVATSRLYDILHVNYLVIPLLVVTGLLIVLSGYLILRAVLQLHFYDRSLKRLKSGHPQLMSILD
jgi:uncharacterized membrane protein YidH (DUF202 family)